MGRPPEPYLQVRTLDLADRPDVEVHVIGHLDTADGWYPGQLRQWVQAADETWWGNVGWQHNLTTRLDHFPDHRIRVDTVDRSRGRA